MTRGQRKAHAIAFRVLAVLLLAAIGFALSRRHVASEIESTSLGRTALHDAPRTPPP